ncbi:MAG: hypothetical protein U0Y82_11135 [Thermoleophilia bacterium]
MSARSAETTRGHPHMDADGFSVLRHEFAQRRREACDRIDGAYPAPATVTTPAALPVGVPVP